MRKQGSGLDLPIAIAIALAEVGKRAPARSALLGELALDGAVRHVDGVLVAARCLKKLGFDRIFVPVADASEAALIEGLEVIPCENLAGVFAHLLGQTQITPQPFTEVAVDPTNGTLATDPPQVHAHE